MNRRLRVVPPPTDSVPGTWLIASMALGRPVYMREEYPHICGSTRVNLGPRDCWACQFRAQRPEVA